STFSARLSGASGVPPTSAGGSGNERRRAKRAHCALLNLSHETGSRAGRFAQPPLSNDLTNVGAKRLQKVSAMACYSVAYRSTRKADDYEHERVGDFSAASLHHNRHAGRCLMFGVDM